jgi:DNA (cytosine-5)-methyltransferase 1
MKIVSLFSGAGGLDFGLKLAGHDIVWANDVDADSCKTYQKNIGNHIFCSDITKVNENDIPRADIIVGGFPCQGFSLANRKRDVNDSRNILYKEFLRIVKSKMPKYFIAENVRGILSLGNGEIINKIISDFSLLGYNVQYKTINFANYGVPQTRVRVIIVGSKKSLPQNKRFVFPGETHNKDNWICINDALKDIPEPDSNTNLLNHIYSKYKITDRNFTGHRLTDPNKPSPTILARGNGKGGVCAIQHPKNHRRMSVRESAIIQTFPIDFEFFGAMNSMYRQVGNAVPVHFANLLGLSLKDLEK